MFFISRYRKKGHWGGGITKPSQKYVRTPKMFFNAFGFAMTWYFYEWSLGYRGAIDIGPLAIHWRNR